MVLTSPNCTWIPEFPILESYGFVQFDDGLWGGQEYSRWPQFISRANIHHIAIPRCPLKGGAAAEGFGPDHHVWKDFDRDLWHPTNGGTDASADPTTTGNVDNVVVSKLTSILESGILAVRLSCTLQLAMMTDLPYTDQIARQK